MDGTSLYVNLRTGPGGTALPPGEQAGDILRWNGSAWLPVAPSELGIGLQVVKYQDLSSEWDPAMKIPAGRILHSIIFKATYGDAPCQLSGGTDAGKDDVFQSCAISGIDPEYNPEGLTTIVVNKLVSATTEKDVVINTVAVSDYWSGSVFDVYLIMIPLL
jgi:hypothetical protein